MKKTITLVFIFSMSICASFAQKRMYKTGMLIDEKPPKGIEIYDFDAMGFGETLPDSISLLEYAPYPGNQGNYSTCVGWSYGYCGTSILYAQKYGIKNRAVITALAMCPFSIYNQIKSVYDSDCEMGTHMHLAATELQKNGTKRFHLNEVGCGQSSEKDNQYKIFKVDNTYAIWDIYREKFVTDSIKILNTRKALAAKKPVLIGFKTTYSFCYDIRSSDGFWEKDQSNLFPAGGHAMSVIGYNDKMQGGCFLIQNSWGREWGKNGYAWVTYKDYATYTYNAYVIELEEKTKGVAAVAKPKGCEYGNCLDGYSRFKFDNGDTYEGDVKNGMPEGNGIYQYANGEVFTGTFKGGKKEGKGTYYFTDGTVKTAWWSSDTINAAADFLDYTYAVIDVDENTTYSGYCKGEDWIFGSYESSGGYSASIYTGKFREGKKDDFGIREFSSFTYVGSIANDAFSKAYAFISNKTKRIYIYTTTEGSFQKATNSVDLSDKIVLFKEDEADTMTTTDKKQCTYGNCQNGYGKFTYASGNTYEGFFNNGYRNGYGKYTTKQGESYEGLYFANTRNDVGKVTLKDGGIFIGRFEFDKRHGYGIYTGKDKKYLAGEWNNDKYVEWEEELGFGGVEEPEAKKTEAKTVKPGKHKAQKQARFTLK
ncbi:MAG TPA: C1 family peptidase [Flavobacteriales bacterium]|nr:C1 family peptidase [Flavobacteriales bacterium]